MHRNNKKVPYVLPFFFIVWKVITHHWPGRLRVGHLHSYSNTKQADISPGLHQPKQRPQKFTTAPSICAGRNSHSPAT